MSLQTRKNWLIDAAVLVGGLLAALTGIYFLYLPSGGYEGGRNPMYSVTIFFERHTWSDLHTWGGLLMIVAVIVHIVIHWSWIVRMGKRMFATLIPGGGSQPRLTVLQLSRAGQVNLAINLAIAISFLLCAVTGVYFLFTPEGGFQGGSNPAWDPGFLFSRTTWDMIHTWSGVALSVAALAHFAIHWRWVKNVTARFFLSLLPQTKAEGALAPN
jgi:cytochrome b subunit of formate dehydrogenase